MNHAEKNRFRQTVRWKRFRDELIHSRGLKCELLGTKLTMKTAQVHHLRPDLYDELRPELFKVLSPSAHDFIEFLAKIANGNRTEIPNREAMMAWLGEFLPVSERSVEKYYRMMEERMEWNETRKVMPDYNIPVLVRVESNWGRSRFTVAYRMADEGDNYQWYEDYSENEVRDMVTHWKLFEVVEYGVD